MRWTKTISLPSIERACAFGLLLAVCSTGRSSAAQAPAPPQAPAAPAARFVVVLDAAHGGDDSGGHSGNWTEKSLTLALSVRLRSLLGARGISVVTTRESDIQIDPPQRIAIADHAGAQACLSLHASLSGSGIHLFASSLAPAQPALFEPWKTAQAASVTRSLALAGVLNSALQHAGMAVTLGRTELPILDSMTCPALAVEISPDRTSTPQSQPQSPVDSLNDPGYQARVAEALAAALVEWRAEEGRLGAGPS
ncbi:MAG TPA: N-acetylmuramoyl-L-alanine amidase [Terracidiphilus sp.]|nr:N-acetylmuramoyl-L-alanine amidase [Terracidiphilus sp.]